MEEFNVTQTFGEPDGDEAGNRGTNNNEEDRSNTLLGPDRKYVIGYDRAPGTPRIVKRSSDKSSSRKQSRTDAVVRRETKQPQPRQMIDRSRTSAPQPTRAITKKRRPSEDRDDDEEEEAPFVEQLPFLPRVKRSRLSNSTQMNAAPESETRNSSFIATAATSVNRPQEEQLQHLRLHEWLASLPDQPLASVASSFLEVRQPKHVHVATKLQSTQLVRQPNDVGSLRRYEPRILKAGESILHCLPSTYELRKMCEILKLGYAPENQLFWHSTYAANQIHAHSKAGTLQEISSKRNIGFEALSLFLTNSEESRLTIQTPLKYYIGKQLVDIVGYDAILNDLINLSRLHLWALSEILEVRVILFSDRGVEIFGDCFNNSVPSMLLQLKNNIFLPVVTIA